MLIPGRSRSERLGLAAALLLFASLALHFRFVCDDAYISFRYARHVAAGAGLRFNLGEEPPVEGYSNLLWTLGLAPFARLGLDLAAVALAASFACGALLLVRATRFAARELALDAGASSATALFLASLPPFAVWATGGLETMAFALAVFAVFESALGARRASACVAAVAATGLRPDGALWVALAVLAALAAARPDETRATRRAAGLALGAALAAWLAQAAFRAGYHDAWLAHTAALKGAPSAERAVRGAQYVASLALELPLLVLAPLAAARLARGERRLRAVAVVLAGAFALAVAVGGDFMAFGRFLVPALPFVALAFAAACRALGRSARGRACVGAVTALALASSLASAFDRAPVPDAWRQALHFRGNEPRARSEAAQWAAMRARAREWLAVGRALARVAQPGESIVLAAIGATAYPNELVVHDVFGLVSPEVAAAAPIAARASPGHDRRVEPSFFLPRRPTYFGAWLAPRDAPLAQGLPPGFERTPLARSARVERVALPADGSFDPGVELRVLRGVYEE